MEARIVWCYLARPVLSMRLAGLTLHAFHLVPRFPLHGHGTPDDWQVRTRCVVADGAGIVFGRNPGSSVFGRKA